MVSLQQFRTLHSVRSHGGIHAAAKALHMSPSAVSQQIKALSSECGFPLVEPDGRGIRLTEKGSRIAQIAYQIASLWEASVSTQQAHGVPSRPRPTVRVGAFPSAMGRCVLPALSGAHDLPFDLRLFEIAPREGRRLVAEGVLDAALSLQEGDGSTSDDSLWAVPLRHDPFLFVGRPALVASVTHPQAARSLSTTPWILPRAGSDCDRLIAAHCARYGITPHPVGRTDDWALAQEMAVTLNALACVPSSTLTSRRDLARALEAGEVPAPARIVTLVARATAALAPWLALLQRRLQQAYTRTAGVVYGT